MLCKLLAKLEAVHLFDKMIYLSHYRELVFITFQRGLKLNWDSLKPCLVCLLERLRAEPIE